MDYAKVLKRAGQLIWHHKFFILLGVLAGLGNNTGNVSYEVNSRDFEYKGEPLPVFAHLPVAFIILLAGLLILLGIAAWVVSTIADGGLIAGVNAIESGGSSTFVRAWKAGWQKRWPLIGITVAPAIPLLAVLIPGLILSGTLAGLSAVLGADVRVQAQTGLQITLVAVICVALPLALFLSLLRVFASRACMLENLGVVAAYRRGWTVLLANLVPALIVFLLQLALSIGLTITFAFPLLIMVVCFIFWPLLILIHGALTAFFSALWTLAWRAWTKVGMTPGD